MNRAQTEYWVEAVMRGHVELDIDVVLIPSLLNIPFAMSATENSQISIGAQDLSVHGRGAFTGETTAADLVDHGCTFVVIGHHEQRTIMGNDGSVISAKLAQAFAYGLTPILCTGESSQGDKSAAKSEVAREIHAALSTHEESLGLPIVVAYEPTWAIGSHQPASSSHINEMMEFIRGELDRLGASHFRLIYGGSAGGGLYPQIADTCDGLFLGRSAHDPTVVHSILEEIYQR